MAENHAILLACCVEALDTYQPELHSVEEHITRYLSRQKGLDEEDETFITEVFSGCVRYDSIMKVVTNGFYIRDGKGLLKSESNLYQVLCYLALFRLDELGVAHFRKFIRTQDVSKMYKFLNFFLGEKNLRTWIKDEWNKLYETSFVQTTLLSPLFRWLPELQEIVQHLKGKIDNKLKPKKKVIPVTESKPFNLTQPRPRSVPMPEKIPKLQKHRPVPKALFDEPKEKTDLQKVREINRRKAEERLMEASKRQFSCANPEKSHKTKYRLNQILAEEDSKLQFDVHKANPLPSHVAENVPIKLNTAAILREGRLFRKREEEEIQRLEKLEAGARDASEFLSWQSEMRQKDLDNELAAIERRRLEGKLSHEDAILARQNLIKENKERVAEMKAEAEEIMKEYLEKRLLEEQDMRQLVEQTMQMHENAKEAKKKLRDYKAKLVQEVNEESQELMRMALEEAEADMRRKVELIQQIRAMEAVPKIRHKFVDMSESAGYGLLSEMSLAELRERLALLKSQASMEEEEKRDEILAAKQAKDQLLMDTLTTISKHRTEMTREMAKKLEDKKKTRLLKPEIKTPELTDLEKKLQERKAARLQEKEKAKVEAKKLTQKARALANTKRAVEQNRWEELEKTREREAKVSSKGLLATKGAGRLLAANPMTLAT